MPSLAGPDPSLSQAFIDALPLQRHIKTNEKNACSCKYLDTTTVRWERVLDGFGGRGHPGPTRVKENVASLSRPLIHPGASYVSSDPVAHKADANNPHVHNRVPLLSPGHAPFMGGCSSCTEAEAEG